MAKGAVVMKRSLITLSVFMLLAMLLTGLIAGQVLAGDQDGKPQAGGGTAPVPQLAPEVSITPRARTGPAAPESALDRRSDIRIDKQMVLVPVAVTTQSGQYVTGLDKENFKVFENNVEQEVESFTSEDAPMSVGVV